MRLHYLISFRENSLTVHLEDRTAKRVLYWDTLAVGAPAEDRAVLLFLKKNMARFVRDFATTPFQQIDIPAEEVFEAMRLLAQTGRVVYQKKPLHCDWQCFAEPVFRAEGSDLISPWLRYRGEMIPLASCERVFPRWCLAQGRAFPLRYSFSWQWLSLFSKGPFVLEGLQRKRFLEDAPPLEQEEKQEVPCLRLTDATGCFANFDAAHQEWEKDLLETGFIRKTVGSSRYFCPGDQVRDALLLLLDVGWEIISAEGKKIYRQSSFSFDLQEKEDVVRISGFSVFQGKSVSLRTVMEGWQRGRLCVAIDAMSIGLLDRSKIVSLEGVWDEEVLELPKQGAAQLFPLLESPQAQWKESLRNTIVSLKEQRGPVEVFPGSSFQGTLLEHQQKGLDWLWFLYERGFAGLLADEMGLGKTVQVLAFFSRLRTNLPILIVAPTSLLFQWRSEIARFLAPSPSSFSYTIISYASLRQEIETLSKTHWEVVVLDESSAIKTASTQTARAASRLNSRFRIALNGTPMENRSQELASQFQFLLPGLIAPASPDLRKAKPFILRRKKEEISLPEKVEQLSWVEMNEAQADLYHSYGERVKKGLLTKIAADGASSHRMEMLEAILRLRQIALDPRLIGQETRGAKIERLLEEVEEALDCGRKVLIYSQFTAMLDQVGKELCHPYARLDGSMSAEKRSALVRHFQEDRKLSLFLLSLKAGGVGLNLTAADTVILLDPWWNDAVENQAIDRAHRVGQTKSVIAKRYIAPNTIEEKMLRLKAEKTKLAQDFLDDGEECFAPNWTAEEWLRLLS